MNCLPRSTRLVQCLLTALMGAGSGLAMAWGSLVLMEPPPAVSTWAAGPSVWALPRSPGAQKTSWTVLPGLDYEGASGLFVSTDTGVGWNLSRRDDLQAGLRLWPQFGRRRADAPAGIDPIGNRLQPQAFLNYAPVPVLLLQSAVLSGSGRHHDGLQLEVGATSGIPIGTDLLGIGLAATFANQAFRQSYFGVSAAESQASGLPVHTLRAGWQDVSLTFSSEHKFTPVWRLSGQLVVARLLDSAARSPLTRSSTQLGATLTLWRSF